MDSLPTERDATVVPEPGRWDCFKWAWKHSTAGTLLDAVVMAVLTIAIAAAVLDLPAVRGEATSVLLGVGALFVLVAVDLTLKLSRAKYELVKLWAQGEVADANRRFVDAAKTRDDAVSRNLELLRELVDLRGSKPRIGRVVIEYAVDGSTRVGLVTLHNDGETATFSANYRVTGPTVEPWALNKDHTAIWSRDCHITRHNEKLSEIAKGARGSIYLAWFQTGPNSCTVQLRAQGASSVIQPCSFQWLESGEHGDPWCEVDLSVFSNPSLLESPKRLRLRITKDGVKLI